MIEFQKNNASLSFSEALLKGDKGDPGVTPNIQIGTVETLPAESPATASMTGTPENPLLNLGIPKGKDGGAGASDFIIRMTVESDDDGNYTVASCDATVEQIDVAVAAEKRVVVIASVYGGIIELPMLQGDEGANYYFGTFVNGSMTISSVRKIYGGTDEWQISVTQIGAEYVGYSNAALPNVANVGGALDDTIDTLQTNIADTESLRAGVSALMNAYQTQGGDIASLKTQAHTHANKGTLDLLSDSNGKLQYNGSDVGLKGDKGDTPIKGTDYWTAADKTEIVNDTLAALPTWTGGGY